MEPKPILLLLVLSHLSTTTTTSQSTTTTTTSSDLHHCLLSSKVLNFTIPSSSSSFTYYHLLNVSIQNLRFTEPTILKPVAVVLPATKNHLRTAVLCCRRSNLTIRVRSGGHSYEGLSYTAAPNKSFVVIDLMNLNQVRVNITTATAWVQSGATLGEIYHAVATKSNGSLAFPAGSCATVGSGGHISGGGFGLLSRMYGLAADNVEDAVLIDSVGQVLNRVSMGEDVFWAIRGGGGGSWGVIYAWKLRLVPVPQRVTWFTLPRTGSSRTIAELVHKWQYVGPSLPDEFYLSIYIDATGTGNVSASFSGLFLGPKRLAISLLTHRFSELELTESGCVEKSWIECVVYFAGLSSTADLTDRASRNKGCFKAKSDYVRTHISVENLTGPLDQLSRQPKVSIILDPYGGLMARTTSSALPFPHRAGNLYGIQYTIGWTEEEEAVGSGEYVAWLRRFYEYMEPLVSRNPRAAYVNYVDLDLGTMDWTRGDGGPRDAVGAGRVWGEKYYLGNYGRLVRAKTSIDPDNVFSNAQSIPPMHR